MALPVTLIGGAEPAFAADHTKQSASAPKKAAATQAADLPSARVAARLSGKRVEALSERTETSTTWVNKDGSLTTELTAGPVRFQDDATGDWRNVDLNLVSGSDGSVEPKGHPIGLKLAAGGGQRLALQQTRGRPRHVTWSPWARGASRFRCSGRAGCPSRSWTAPARPM